jgi:phosphoribosylanthranilate isomerase
MVGVFVDAPLENVAGLAEACALDFIQLHGSESPEYCDQLRALSGVPIIKAFRAADIPNCETLGRYETTSYFLFDLDKKNLEDDELTRLTETLWEHASRRGREGFRIMIAGALGCDNVRQAVERTHPYCVDVCRGVESEPGVKDHDAIVRFVGEVRQ